MNELDVVTDRKKYWKIVMYYCIVAILFSFGYAKDSLEVVTLCIGAVSLLVLATGIVKAGSHWNDVRWILLRIIYPMIVCALFIAISIHLHGINYSKEGLARAYDELNITQENYQQKTTVYEEICKEYLDKEGTLDKIIDKNRDLEQNSKDLDKKWKEYQGKYPQSLVSEYNTLVATNQDYINEIARLEREIEQSKLVSNTTNSTKQESNKVVNDTSNTNNKGQSSTQSSGGTSVYIADGNKYYHKTSSCKFIKGLSTHKVKLEDYPNKYQCNCWKY